MKKKGCDTEFKAERVQAIRAAFSRELVRSAGAKMTEVMERVARTPCSRFWVSEERAYKIVRKLYAGEAPLGQMNEEKQRMFREIYLRVMRIAAGNPSRLYDATVEVVNGPAPEFYLSPRYIYNILCKNRRA